MASETINFSSIGVFHSSQVHPYEAGRQPDDVSAEGVIELSSGHNFEQALVGLNPGERIWILFLFHHNTHWNPMVLPPRGVDSKIGVFATRSPYRPNPIGISCVKIKKIEKLKIYIEGSDLLNESPILDIKPYLAYADSFPGSEPAWLKEADPFFVEFSDEASSQLNWLEQNGLQQLKTFLQHQLEFEPTNSRKKRVKVDGDHYVLAYRTWRARFSLNHQQVRVEKIFSGYSESELNLDEDPYADKDLHRSFLKNFC
ncbi:MAG TPA: tRNA (N6-threonylcarbamoyladenosine(37)-N6)-methyltransferase TrmO [Bdellovibrio sp.]|nr:tRNA (N6-threonylcarbamoyladenosine(37)-N6)-methyltransferase TrmO [Bdellovibrio sp.]